ncbi:MAG: hypothetical protein HYX53_16550 [Chloroflexi bacterium]|nr:hypothetical protein [Chloroflexota bacterium]
MARPTRTPTSINPSDFIRTSQDAANKSFRGAECYGDKVSSCLGANPELDARAADPALCQGPEARVCLVPVGNVRTDVVDAIVAFHRETRGIEVLVLPSIPVRPTMIYPETSQVSNEVVLQELGDVYGVTDKTASTFIAITPIDMRPLSGEYAWLFGTRYGQDQQGNRTRGVFSYFRMANVPPYDGGPLTPELLQLRAAKYTARYTALLYFDYPTGSERRYLNYESMFGIGDLDSMGTAWPPSPAPGP